MKKIKNLVVAFVIAGFGFTSCSSDDNSASNEVVTIEHKWNQLRTTTKVGAAAPITNNYTDNVQDCSKNYIEFAANSVLKNAVYFKQDGCQVNIVDEGRWTKTDDKLVITNAGQLSGTYDIETLNSNALTIKSTTSSAAGDVVTTVFFSKAVN